LDASISLVFTIFSLGNLWQDPILTGPLLGYSLAKFLRERSLSLASKSLEHHLFTTTMVRSASHNDRFLDKTPVADIKLNAREAVNREARGASAITLIKIARAQTLSAREHEAKGDLRNALASFIKAATLAKMAMDSTEFAQKGGVLRNELTDFVEVSLSIIT
jgi:hypothetical protein